jgi:urease accessory protein
VEIAGKLALVEELNLDGSHGVPGIIGDNRVLDTCMMFGERIDQVGTMPRVLQLEQPGSMARHIGMQTHNSVVNSLWSSWTDKVKSVA